MKECKYWIVVLLQLCILSISCGEKGAKQVAPAQDHAILKFENNTSVRDNELYLKAL